MLVGGFIGTILGVLFFNQMRRIGQLETVITLSYVVLLGSVGTLVSWESLAAVIKAGKGAAAPSHRRPSQLV